MNNILTFLLLVFVPVFKFIIYPKIKKAREERLWIEEQSKYRITIIDLINETQCFVGKIDSLNGLYSISYDYNRAHVFVSHEDARRYAHSIEKNDNISILILAGSKPIEKIH